MLEDLRFPLLFGSVGLMESPGYEALMTTGLRWGRIGLRTLDPCSPLGLHMRCDEHMCVCFSSWGLWSPRFVCIHGEIDEYYCAPTSGLHIYIITGLESEGDNYNMYLPCRVYNHEEKSVSCSIKVEAVDTLHTHCGA
jgi:hypothetical protein